MTRQRSLACAGILLFSLAVLPGQVCPFLIVPGGGSADGTNTGTGGTTNTSDDPSAGSATPGDTTSTDPTSNSSFALIQGPAGPTGPAGTAGPQGSAGPQGAAGANAVITTGIGIKNTGGVLSVDSTTLDPVLWKLNGNTGTTPGNNILGTTDNKPFEIHSNGQSVLRISPDRSARFDLDGNQSVEIKFVAGLPLDKLITLSSGAYMTPQGNWLAVSDRSRKENFQSANGRDVLSRVVAMPISTWNYIGTNSSVRHMGPMAQDFFAGFGLGGDDQHVCPLDTSGVALAAIQGLHDLIKEKNDLLTQQQSRIDDLETRLKALESKLGQ